MDIVLFYFVFICIILIIFYLSKIINKKNDNDRDKIFPDNFFTNHSGEEFYKAYTDVQKIEKLKKDYKEYSDVKIIDNSEEKLYSFYSDIQLAEKRTEIINKLYSDDELIRFSKFVKENNHVDYKDFRKPLTKDDYDWNLILLYRMQSFADNRRDIHEVNECALIMVTLFTEPILDFGEKEDRAVLIQNIGMVLHNPLIKTKDDKGSIINGVLLDDIICFFNNEEVKRS